MGAAYFCCCGGVNAIALGAPQYVKDKADSATAAFYSENDFIEPLPAGIAPPARPKHNHHENENPRRFAVLSRDYCM